MVRDYNQYRSERNIFWISPWVNSSDFALRATTGKIHYVRMSLQENLGGRKLLLLKPAKELPPDRAEK